MRNSILVIGSLNMDFIARVPRFPLPGETVLGESFARAPGGKGANQAVAASRLGGAVRMIGRVGDDEFGRFLRGTLEEAHVDATEARADPGSSTGLAFILVNTEGQNSIVAIQGANLTIRREDIRSLGNLLDEAAILLVQLEIPVESVEEALRQARQRGVRVVLESGPPRRLPDELLGQVDVLSPNETELASIVDREVRSPDEVEGAVDQVLSLGVGSVVLKLGEQGCLVATPQMRERIAAFRVRAVDTTGAGDAFTAALAVALTEGNGLRDAATFANAAGALATTRPGAQPSMPHRAEVVELLTSRR